MADYSCLASPAVSVIMPAYNSEKYISAAINSVLGQSFANWELIIADDCSSDRTVEIVNGYIRKDKRIKCLLSDKNTGASHRRNLALSECKGKYVAFLDSDDVWHYDKLEKQVALAEESSCDIVYCSYALIDENGNKSHADFIVSEAADLNSMLVRNEMSCSTVLLKRSVADKYRFNSKFYHEDYVFWLQLLIDGYKAVGIAEVLADYRVIAGSKSHNKFRSAANRWSIYRKFLHIPLFKSLILMAEYTASGISKYK